MFLTLKILPLRNNSPPDTLLTEKVQRLAVDVPEPLKLLSVFTDVFDCIFRFISAILDESGTLSEIAALR
ncbi:siderophore biosynthesis protein [Erwinia tracheiphila PSU-1]|nr:siderophore biosynthesis protein [Erwinia tracheiphila PSU-1]